MGFWSTVLVALRFRSGQVPAVTDPLHTHRIWLDGATRQRVRTKAVSVRKIRADVESVHQVRLEAR